MSKIVILAEDGPFMTLLEDARILANIQEDRNQEENGF